MRFSALWPAGSETCQSHSCRRRWGGEAQPHSCPETPALQGGWELQWARSPWQWFYHSDVLSRKNLGDFRLVPDSWASGRPGKADLHSILPNCFTLQSCGSPWQCKSRSAAPVLPVTPTAPDGFSLIAHEPYSSFTLKHEVWYPLKPSDLVHMCNLPADQTSPGRSISVGGF